MVLAVGLGHGCRGCAASRGLDLIVQEGHCEPRGRVAASGLSASHLCGRAVVVSGIGLAL